MTKVKSNVLLVFSIFYMFWKQTYLFGAKRLVCQYKCLVLRYLFYCLRLFSGPKTEFKLFPGFQLKSWMKTINILLEVCIAQSICLIRICKGVLCQKIMNLTFCKLSHFWKISFVFCKLKKHKKNIFFGTSYFQ